MASEQPERAEQVRNARKKVRREENIPPPRASLRIGSVESEKSQEEQMQQTQVVVKQLYLPASSSSSTSTTGNTTTTTTTTASKRHSRLRQSSSSSSASSPLQPRFAQSSPSSTTSDQWLPEKQPVSISTMISSPVEEDRARAINPPVREQPEIVQPSAAASTFTAVPANPPIKAATTNEQLSPPVDLASAISSFRSSTNTPLALLLPATTTTKHGRTRSRHTRSGSSISGFTSTANSNTAVVQGMMPLGEENVAEEVRERSRTDDADGRVQEWEMGTLNGTGVGAGAGAGTGSIRAVQPLSSPSSDRFRQSGFTFGRAAAAVTTGEMEGSDEAGFGMPLLPAEHSVIKDNTFSFPAMVTPHAAAPGTSFSFPQSKSLAPARTNIEHDNKETPSSRPPLNACAKSPAEQLDGRVPRATLTMPLPLPVPQVTVVPSTPIGEDTFRYGDGAASGSAYGLGFGFGDNDDDDNNNSGSKADYGSGSTRKAGDEFTFPAFPMAFAGQDVNVSGSKVDMLVDVERNRGEDECGKNGREDEKSRFHGFTFGSARQGSSSPPLPTGLVTTMEQEMPTADTRRRRHSHTRSTSISTRAAFIPTTSSASALLSSSEPMGRALSRSPSPSDHAIDVRGGGGSGEQHETMEERQRTLFALEGREGRVSPSAAGGEGDTPRWLAGLQAFAGTGIGGAGVGDAIRTSKRSSRRRSRIGGVSETTTMVEIALPPMDDDDDSPGLSAAAVGQGQGEATGGLATTPNPTDGFFPLSPLAPVSPSRFPARHTDARGNPIPLAAQVTGAHHLPPPSAFHFSDVATATGPAPPLGACALNELGIEGLLASTSMASQATNLGTLIEEDESEVVAAEPGVDDALEAGREREKEKGMAGSVFTPDRAKHSASGMADSPDVSSATSFRIRPLRLLSMSSNSTNSFSSTPMDQDAQSVGSRRSLSIEALRSPSTGKATENGTHVTPLSLSDPPKRFSIKRNSAGMGSKLFSSYTSDSGSNKRSSVASSHTSGSRVLNEVEETPRSHNEKEDIRSFALLRRRSMSVSGQNPIPSSSGETVDELKRFVTHLEMEKHTMQEDIEGWQSRCRGLEMQLKHEKEQGVFLRERVRKLGDHLSSLSGLATSSTPTSPYHAQTDSPSSNITSIVQSPTQAALMRNELFKLTSVIAQLTAEKEQARAEAATLRAKLEMDERAVILNPTLRTSAEEHESQGVEHEKVDNPPPTRSVLGYISPTPSRIAKVEPENDIVARIRGFSFPRGPISSSSSSSSVPATTSRASVVRNAFFTAAPTIQPDSPICTTMFGMPSSAQCDDDAAVEDDPTAFQIPLGHATSIDDPPAELLPLDYKAYAPRQIPPSSSALFSIADKLPALSRCIGFENTCGSCRGKVFHL
ncbi:hypothetical protein QFC22_006677 [Naganishia vaughanmartiniae]|uniref:Uncharacterized protein n=1 Tax=Naganishia vaughanmartiniae TaxID=1424756 RepID=A0ACC2WI21_9TREE|nr:hypothetical protein QFC22_006677 [Naganishia vaughanmartiniae]